MPARHRPQIREALGQHEAGWAARELRQAVRHRRRAEAEVHRVAEDAGERDAGVGGRRLERGEEPLDRRAGCGRRLAAPSARAVGQEAVGERAADVDPDRPGGHAAGTIPRGRRRSQGTPSAAQDRD
jgi:hypothetical protein